jgi:hypothetical protein
MSHFWSHVCRCYHPLPPQTHHIHLYLSWRLRHLLTRCAHTDTLLVANIVLVAVSSTSCGLLQPSFLILVAVGAEAEEERVSKLLGELEGKDIAEVVAAGLSKLASGALEGRRGKGGERHTHDLALNVLGRDERRTPAFYSAACAR